VEWTLETGIVISMQIAVSGSYRDHNCIEEIGLVTGDGLDRFFAWDMNPSVPEPSRLSEVGDWQST
jgi:hypothetical protein